MTTNFLPLSALTDEELLGRVYITNTTDPMVLELAARLQHALDEMRKPRVSLDAVIASVSTEGAYGSDA